MGKSAWLGQRNDNMPSDDKVSDAAASGWRIRFVSEHAIHEGSPLVLPVGSRGTLELSYLHQGEPIRKGGSLHLQERNAVLVLYAQTTEPAGICYCSWETSANAVLDVSVRAYRGMLTEPFLSVTVQEGMIARGDTFTCRMGDRTAGGPGMCVYATAAQGSIIATLDRDGSGHDPLLPASHLPLLITARTDPAHYRLLLASVVQPGEPFTVRCSAWDLYRNRCLAAAGTLELSGVEAFSGMPSTINFAEEHKGFVTINNVCVNQEGLHRIAFSDKASGLSGLSNPLLVQSEPAHRVYWGDLHCHGYGDRSGYMPTKTPLLDPAHKTQAMKDGGGLDFASLSPMNLPEPGTAIWQDYQQAVEHHMQDGFAAFQAKEFHCNPGRDRTVIFRDGEDAPIHSLVTAGALYAAYAEREDVLIECHVGGGAADWQAYTYGEEDLLEVTSGHGNFEWFLQEALQRGFHPAVIGASDAHYDLPGSPRGLNSLRGRFTPGKTDGFLTIPRDWGFAGGSVAAVCAQGNTRQTLWQQMRARHTYATTGARILLDLSVNDQPMGSQITTDTPPHLRISAYGTARIRFVDVIRGNRLLKRFTPNTLDFSDTLTDESLPQEDATWYYIRLRQEDGEYAWSTPIWVHNTGFAPKRTEALPPWYAPALWPHAADPHAVLEASRYTQAAMDGLRLCCDVDRLAPLVPVGIVHETPGRTVLFHSAVMPEHFPISIRYYCDFELPGFHFDYGWEDFGLSDGFEPLAMDTVKPNQ